MPSSPRHLVPPLPEPAPLVCQRDRFRLPTGAHYLNCAYMAPLSRGVEAAGIAALERWRMPANIGPDAFFDVADRVRSLAARVLGVPDAQSIALVPAVSYAVAIAARNLRLSRGQEIVLIGDDFPSDVLIWRRLAADLGLVIRTVDRPKGEGDVGVQWNDRLRSAITSNTAVAVLAPVHWQDGTRFDVSGLTRHAHERGAGVIVDATQAAGAYPIDVTQMAPDLVVASAYKWLFGPYGVGLAYIGPRFASGSPLEEPWTNRRGSDDFASLAAYVDEYRAGASRFDVGGRPNFTLLPMMAAALEQILEWGVARIQAYCRSLTDPLIAWARGRGLGTAGDATRVGHLIGLRLPAAADPNRVQTALAARHVFVARRGDVVRVSPNVYNDRADIHALTDALDAAL